MIHHILKDIKEICPYCGAGLEKEEYSHYGEHNYITLFFKCGKKVFKKTDEFHNSNFIKTLEDY